MTTGIHFFLVTFVCLKLYDAFRALRAIFSGTFSILPNHEPSVQCRVMLDTTNMIDVTKTLVETSNKTIILPISHLVKH